MTIGISDSISAARPLAGRKVLIIVENLPVPFDRRVWQEATTLRDSGAEVAVICPVGKGFTEKYEVLHGIHIYRHSLPIEAKGFSGFILEYGSALLWETLLTWKVFFKHGFDVLHACNPPDLIFFVALPFKLLGKKFIFDHHDINPELYEAKFRKRGMVWKLLCYLEKISFKMANIVISTNESYKEIAEKRGGKSSDSVYVVRSGPDLSRVKTLSPNTSWKNGRQYLVGYVGVMGEQEGLDLLIDSIHYIVNGKGRRDIQFVLVGSGPEQAHLQEYAKRRNVLEYVTFPGRVSDEILFEILTTAEICVNPDRVNTMNDKSTMNKILEYMAMGKPIVQFDVKEGRFSAGDSSLYAKPNDSVDFADKILALLEDENLRNEMGKLGRHRVETKLAWKYEAPKLLKAYCRCLECYDMEIQQ